MLQQLKNTSNQGLCLDKNKTLGLLDTNLQNQNNEDFYSKYYTIDRIKCNADNKTQSLKM